MSNRVFKNYQVNLGMPFQIKVPPGLRNINIIENSEMEKEDETPEKSAEEAAEELIANAREEAQLLLKEAEYESAKIIENSQKEAEAGKTAAFEEAWQKGYEQGITEGKNQYEGLIEEAEEKRFQAQKDYDEIMAGIEADAVDMILDIARKVIGNELSANRESVLHMLKQAFEKCSSRERVILCISPQDYDYVDKNREKLLTMVDGIHELDIKKDPAMKAGNFLVRTDFGNVDGSMETKLRKIEEAFKELSG